MTPHKHSAGGSFVTDRQFRGIGRVHRASGITREATYRLFDDGLTELAKEHAGREWIRAYQRLEIDGVDLWGVIKSGKWREPPRPETSKPLVEAIEAWIEDMADEVSDDTTRVRRELVTKVKEHGRAGATVAELPAVLRAVKTAMKKAAPSFNLLRNYTRAFVRDTLGTRHEIYLAIQHDIGAIKIPGHAKKKERKRHPLTPAQVQLLASKFSTVAAGGGAQEGHGYTAIAMALTGMHPKEYFVDGFDQAPTYVHVRGEKREGRDRLVPKLFPSALWPHPVLRQPTITKHSFERAFAAARKAAKLTCSPLDLRRSFANWMESAGLDRTRRRMYLGHNPGDVTDLYETQELLQLIAVDGETLVAWINEQLRLAQRPRLVEDGR